MLDSHSIPEAEWGISPVLFTLWNIQVPSYSFFVGLGLFVGLAIYWLEARKQKTVNEHTLYILLAALVGGVIGAKLATLIAYWSVFWETKDLSILIYGKSIVGGLIGGTIAVLLLKKKLGIKEKKGNLFAPAIALGVAIGRIGCFLRGCCYGVETSLPWGVDFGDGIFRHPTELYESIFMLGMFVYLQWKKNQHPKPGQLFKILMIAYFTFRFCLEFIRVEPVFFLGLTIFQWLSLLALGYLVLMNRSHR